MYYSSIKLLTFAFSEFFFKPIYNLKTLSYIISRYILYVSLYLGKVILFFITYTGFNKSLIFYIYSVLTSKIII